MGVFVRRSTLLREFEELGKVTRKEMGEILGAYNVKVAPESLDEVCFYFVTLIADLGGWIRYFYCIYSIN